MEIVELVIQAEGDEGGRRPGEDVAAMRGVIIPEAEDEPDHEGADMEGGVELHHCEVGLEGEDLEEEVLDVVEVPGSDGDDVLILVVLLVEAV